MIRIDFAERVLLLLMRVVMVRDELRRGIYYCISPSAEFLIMIIANGKILEASKL